MADTPFSQVIFNAREEAESDDWNRLQKLSSRELQNLMRGLHRAPSYSDAPFLAGAPISGVLTAPSLMGVAGSYSMTLGAGDGFFELAGASSDSSSYRVLRWAEQAIVFGVPDPVNPRIDLVVATPGTEGTDQQVRTIRVDPNSNPPVDKDAPVPKTLNPKTTISVVAGVAGGSPAAPAVPAGSIALFEVYIPGGAVDTTSFEPVRRAHRLAEHPLASQPCILRGCHVLWDMTVNPANANPGISMRTEDSAAVIDGEVIEWYQPPAFVRDTLADPMALPAIANICKPYYLYLCGGRHLPQLSRSTGRATPVVVVESMTAPEIDRQRPSAPINTPRQVSRSGRLRRHVVQHGALRRHGGVPGHRGAGRRPWRHRYRVRILPASDVADCGGEQRLDRRSLVGRRRVLVLPAEWLLDGCAPCGVARRTTPDGGTDRCRSRP